MASPLKGQKQAMRRLQRLGRGIYMTLLPELLSFDALCSTAVCTLCAYYAYKVGYLLGANASTPELASVFSDRRVLQNSFYPHEIRLYAQLLLAFSACTMVWSLYLGLGTLEQEPILLGPASSVSPKLPLTSDHRFTPLTGDYKYTPLTGSFLSLSPRQRPAVIRGACVSRIKKFVVLFCFAFAFLRRQYIQSTLIYHPVNSPAIIANMDNSLADGQLSDELAFKPTDGVSTDFVARSNVTVVPSIVHFVFGMSEDFGGKPFAYAHYLSMMSAVIENKPDEVMFWHHFLPSSQRQPNWWYDRAVRDTVAMGVTFRPQQAPQFDHIFGRKIDNFAHKADIIRLKALMSFGGIYVDLDVYTIRSFDPLRHFQTVLGLEGGVSSFQRQGLCNGVIIAAPNSTFLQRWYESYRTFDQSNWAGHSVKKPLKLAHKHPTDVLVLGPLALFYPGWNNDGLRMVHSRGAEVGGEGWDFDDSQQFAYHAWSSFTGKKWLAKITPDKVFEVETSFNLLVRRWTPENLRKDWRAAKAAGLVD